MATASDIPRPPPLAGARPGHIPQLDGLRGAAALAVVFAHFNPAGLSYAQPSDGSLIALVTSQASRFSLGNLAVAFFFTLSAFLLTYRARLEFAQEGRFSALRFLARRCLRIWPLYFFVLGTSLLIVGLASGSLRLAYGAGAGSGSWLWSHAWMFGAFLSNWSLALEHIAGHADASPASFRLMWSIAVEEQLYLVYPLLMLAALRIGRGRLALPLLVVAGSWAFRAWFAQLPRDAGFGQDGGLYYATLSYGDSFALGAVAGWAAAEVDRALLAGFFRPWLGPALALSGLVIGRAWSTRLWYPYTPLSLGLYSIVAVYFALCLLWMVANAGGATGRFFGSRIPRALGRLSYGIYLWHATSNAVLVVLMARMLGPGRPVGDGWITLNLLLSLLFAVAFAAVTYRFIEGPFLRAKDRMRPERPAEEPCRPKSPRRVSPAAAAFALLLVGAAWLYHWEPATFPRRWTTANPEGFYNELGDAFRLGQTHLERQADPRLVALADPYDPARNEAFRVNDLSYFKGRYYLYMGAAPALATFLPFRLLTGRYMTQEACVWIYCVIGMAASCGMLLMISRPSHGASPRIVLGCALVVLALANGFYAVIQGSIAQHVTIAGGFAFSMLSLLFLARALKPSGRPWAWFALASLAYGAAIASRPNYVFGSLMLLPPLLLALRGRAPGERAQLLGAASLPLGLVVGLVLAYNGARFGNPLEFGQRYQLGGWNQLHLAYSGLGQVRENIRNFLFGPAITSPFFPFIVPKTWVATGILSYVPWLWLAPVAAWALVRRSAPPPAVALALSASVLCGLNFVSLIILPSGNPSAVVTSANGRYVLDFLPALLVAVGAGIALAGAASTAWPAWLRRAFVAATAALAVASVLLGLSLDLGRFPSESYEPVAKVLNAPSYYLLSRQGSLYGPLRLRLELPPGRTGGFEPLVCTGTTSAGDLLLVHYDSPDTIRLGFMSTGFVGPSSPPIRVDYGRPHDLTISMGALYPPSDFAGLEKLDEPQVAYLRRHLTVDMDGARVFEALVPHHGSLPSMVYPGQNRVLMDYSVPQFSGTILSVSRVPVSPPSLSSIPKAAYGPLRITLAFPDPPPAGSREPLVVTGVAQAGDFVTVEYSGSGSIRLALDHWGAKGVSSAWLPVEPGATHVLEVSLGSLLPAADKAGLAPGRFSALKGTVRLSLDGTPVLNADHDTYESSPYDVTVGINAIGGSTCGYAFSGRILSVEREPIR